MIKNFLKHVLPSFAWNQLSRMAGQLRMIKLDPSVVLRWSFELAGYTIAPKSDYDSPLPSVSHLKKKTDRWYRPSALEGIDFNLEKMKADLFSMLSLYLCEFSTIPAYEQLHKEGYGPGYTGLDALTLYLMIRHLKPRRYIEVGCGLSTYYCSLAAKKNASEGHPLHITCIDPYPAEKLGTIPGVQVISKEVQDVGISLFKQLQKNDVLFVDSSHIVKIDGDVPFLYLEVLPILTVGAMVHIHDVPFPYNVPYPPELHIFGQPWPVFWNEAMLLQAFLCFNPRFKIEMSTPLIRYLDEAFLKKNIPIYKSTHQDPNTFSSIWLRRVS